MTIQTHLNDGHKTTSKVIRQVYTYSDLNKIYEGFYAQRDLHKWGVIEELKGKERTTLRTFGDHTIS